MALGNILITAVPTPSGIVSSKFRDGNDSGAGAPTTPEIGIPIAVDDDVIDIPLQTAATGGAAPLVYEMERSATSDITGFSVVASSATMFTGDGIHTQAGHTASTTYWYRLAVVDNDGRRSGYSTVRQVSTPAAGGAAPGAPTLSSVVDSGSSTATLTFTAGTGTTTNYDILLGDGDGAGNPVGSGAIIAAGIAASPYVATGLPTTQIYFRVRGKNGSIAGAYSSRVFITLAAGETAGVLVENFETCTVGALVWVASAHFKETNPQDSNTAFVRSNPSLARSGSRYMESTIDRDEAGGSSNERSEVRWEDPDNIPCVLTATAAGTIYCATVDFWIGFSVKPPSTWKVLFPSTSHISAAAGTPNFAGGGEKLPIVLQIHHNKNTSVPPYDTSGNPPVSITLTGNSSTDPAAVPLWGTRISRNQVMPTSAGNDSDISTAGRIAQLGQWTDFVIQMRYHPFTGYCRIYCRDTVSAGTWVLLQERIGGVGYAKNTSMPHFKPGGYYSLWNVQNFGDRFTVTSTNVEVRSIQLLYDEFRVFPGNGVITDVQPPGTP